MGRADDRRPSGDGGTIPTDTGAGAGIGSVDGVSGVGTEARPPS